jgi:hypothetical protein
MEHYRNIVVRKTLPAWWQPAQSILTNSPGPKSYHRPPLAPAPPAPRAPFEVEDLGRGAQSDLTVALLTPEALEVLLP